MRNPHGTGRATREGNLAVSVLLLLVPGLFVFLAGCSNQPSARAEFVYVAVPEASLRDHVATIYNKTGLVHNGERLQVLERMESRRFVRVRTPRGEEGWLQERFLADQQTYDQFVRLSAQYRDTPAQATATVEDEIKVHVTPGRKAGYLYLLSEKDKVELLQRQPIDRNAALGQESKPPESAESAGEEPEAGPPAIWEDWWLVRDSQKRVGWVLGRALYLDAPEEIAQYAEGQRIVAVYKLDDTQDRGQKVPEYLELLTEPKDGLPYDFNQIRVYTWNARKHRYETAYHERGLYGMLPVTLGQQDFGKEGLLRTFTLNLQVNGGSRRQTYKFQPPIVRKVLAPGETSTAKPKRKATSRKRAAKSQPPG